MINYLGAKALQQNDIDLKTFLKYDKYMNLAKINRICGYIKLDRDNDFEKNFLMDSQYFPLKIDKKINLINNKINDRTCEDLWDFEPSYNYLLI